MNLYLTNLKIKDKHMRELASALQKAGLSVSITGKQHIRVENPKTKVIVFFGAQSLGDWRVAKNINRQLRMVGFDMEKRRVI